MALHVLFCKDLMVNAENSLVSTFTLFPKHVTFAPQYGKLVPGKYLNSEIIFHVSLITRTLHIVKFSVGTV